MAKKKNSSKKHTFKHSVSREAAAPAVSASTDTPTAATPAAPAKAPATLRTATAGATTRDFRYVAGDMKRIGILSAGLIALEVVLYYLMVSTPLGETITNLVKV